MPGVCGSSPQGTATAWLTDPPGGTSCHNQCDVLNACTLSTCTRFTIVGTCSIRVHQSPGDTYQQAYSIRQVEHLLSCTHVNAGHRSAARLLPCRSRAWKKISQISSSFSISTRSVSPFCFGMMSVVMLKLLPSLDRLPPSSPIVSMFRTVLLLHRLHAGQRIVKGVTTVIATPPNTTSTRYDIFTRTLHVPYRAIKQTQEQGAGVMTQMNDKAGGQAATHCMNSSISATDTLTSRTPSKSFSSGDGGCTIAVEVSGGGGGVQHVSPGAGGAVGACSMSTCADEARGTNQNDSHLPRLGLGMDQAQAEQSRAEYDAADDTRCSVVSQSKLLQT